MDGSDRHVIFLQTDGDVFALTDDVIVSNRILADDHKAIFDMAMLLDELTNNDGKDSVVVTALSFIGDLVEGHCLREEKAMRMAHYPRAATHAATHARFQRQLQRLLASYQAGDTAVAAKIGHFVASWFRHHIARDDQRYESWISTVAVDARPLVEFLVDESAAFGSAPPAQDKTYANSAAELA
jgi:hemerythrin-like metal-binding protein